jgi:hypothetical protein
VNPGVRPIPVPNTAVEPTSDRLCSCLAQAIGRGSPRALVRQAKLGVFWQGAHPCGVRPHPPRLPSVAAVEEATAERPR